MTARTAKLYPRFGIPSEGKHLTFANGLGGFSVVGRDDSDPVDTWQLTNERNMWSYSEVLEVAGHMNAIQDGNIYAVSDTLGNVIPKPLPGFMNRDLLQEISDRELLVEWVIHLTMPGVEEISAIHTQALFFSGVERQAGTLTPVTATALVKLDEELFRFLGEKSKSQILGHNPFYAHLYLTLMTCYYAGASRVLMTYKAEEK
jgi:hypothetical protein